MDLLSDKRDVSILGAGNHQQASHKSSLQSLNFADRHTRNNLTLPNSYIDKTSTNSYTGRCRAVIFSANKTWFSS